MATKKTTAPRAEYATKAVTPLIQEFCDWIEREVGVKFDADARRAVYLGSALRTEFQKSNRAEKQAALDSITVPAKRTPQARKAADPDAVKPAPRPRKGSTIAATGHDGKPVVIAEQRHIEVA